MGDYYEVKQRLLAGGFGGLYYQGECGCEVDDFAPCGYCEHKDGEEWINECEAGYKHIDPRSGDFVISPHKEPPTTEEFDRAFNAM